MDFRPIERAPQAFQQPVTPDTIQAIGRRVFGSETTVVSAVELGSGMYNNTYRVALAGQEAKFVMALLTDLGRPDLAEPVLRGPGPHQAPVMQFLEDTFATRTRDEWDQHLSQLDVCYGPVKTLPEALRDPHLQTRGMVREDHAGVRHVGTPIHFTDEPARPVSEPPGLDEYRHSSSRDR